MAELNRAVAKRRDELARFTHNLNLLATRVGQAEVELTRLVSSSSQYLGEIAEQDVDVSRLVRELPGTLTEGREALISMRRLAGVMGPAFEELRPFARNLEGMNESSIRFAEAVTPVIRDEIRPFVRVARERVPDIRTAATRFATTAPRLETVFSKLNKLGNMAAYNPDGRRARGHAGTRRGLPVLGQLAGPQHVAGVRLRRRQRVLPPRLRHHGLRAGECAGHGPEPRPRRR